MNRSLWLIASSRIVSIQKQPAGCTQYTGMVQLYHRTVYIQRDVTCHIGYVASDDTAGQTLAGPVYNSILETLPR